MGVERNNFEARRWENKTEILAKIQYREHDREGEVL